MARDGHERSAETPGHVLDEARLAAAGWTFEHHRQASAVAGLEDRHLVADREVVRRVGTGISHPFAALVASGRR